MHARDTTDARPLFDDARATRPRTTREVPLEQCRPAGWRAPPPPAPAEVGPDHEVAILTALAAPVPVGLSASAGFARKELALRAIFAAMPALECRALHHRLAVARDDDRIAQRFRLLVADRRERLLAFLADARRREALRARR